MSTFFVLLFLGAKISVYFACAIALYFYSILFCFDVYEVFNLSRSEKRKRKKNEKKRPVGINSLLISELL